MTENLACIRAQSQPEALDGSWIDKLQELLDDTADALQDFS